MQLVCYRRGHPAKSVIDRSPYCVVGGSSTVSLGLVSYGVHNGQIMAALSGKSFNLKLNKRIRYSHFGKPCPRVI